MIKVYSTFHDPIDIYDHFKNNFGQVYMLIKKNYIIIKIQDIIAAENILINNKEISIKGLPLKIYRYQNDQNLQQKNQSFDSQKLGNHLKMGKDSNTAMQLENNFQEHESLNKEIDQIMQKIKIKMKKIKGTHQEKIKQIKKQFPDQENCNLKISEFNRFYQSLIKRNKKSVLDPFNSLTNNIRQFNLFGIQEAIDLQPSLQSRTFYQQKLEINSPKFVQKLTFANPQKNQVKRLCLLNQNDFISTQKTVSKLQNKGFLKVYRKKQVAPKFSIQIQQGAYSLLCLDNFILTGDYAGHIHFIDIQNQNQVQYSNRLHSGLIFEMQKYQNKQKNNSILTLLSNQNNQFRIKLFQIQKEQIQYGVNSLTFHPKEQLICEDITMTMEVLSEGKFVYGSHQNTYICNDLNFKYYGHISHDYKIMKIKKHSENKIIEATQKKIYLTDIHNKRFQKQFTSKFLLRSIQKLSQNLVFYGGTKGEVGVIDFRNTKQPIWAPSIEQNNHTGKISDILLMRDSVITCDSNGIISQWKNQSIL